MIEKAHAKYSASGSERWLNCPASIALSEKAPPQIESPYAAEGTLAHECLEKILKGEPYKRHEFSDEMLEHASKFQEWLDTLMAGAPVAKAILIEEKVDLPGVGFGTVDVALVHPNGVLTIIDYKYGAGYAVEPKNNTQMLYYACAIAGKYGWAFNTVHMIIYQPRAYHEDGPIRGWEIPITDLVEWDKKFLEGVIACEDPFAPFKAGSWCRWCPAATLCPEISDRAAEEAKLDFDDNLNVTTPVSVFSVGDLGVALTACEKIENWIEKVREYALQIAQRGEKIPGYKLVAKRSTRKWIDENKTAKIAKTQFGSKAFTKPELLSPAQLEKVIKDKDWIAEHVSDISSGVTLVPENDKRPAVNQIMDDFAVDVIHESIDISFQEKTVKPLKPKKEKTHGTKSKSRN